MKYKLTYLIFLIAQFSAALAQKPEASETEALLTVIAQNSDKSPREGEQIYFESVKSKKVFTGITAENGRFYLLVPKGDAYNVRYKNFQDSVDYSLVDIPNHKGKVNFEFTLTIEAPKVYTLRNVHFDTGKSTLRPESFTALNDLAEVMSFKKKMVVEIAGHTDDVGDDAANMKLSQSRAEAVVKYLTGKGIARERLSAKGYGETQPASYNDTPEGRQENRRTEVRIIKE
jgi:outer membrane protein OmpA-like peptidoglycan-associated protein